MKLQFGGSLLALMVAIFLSTPVQAQEESEGTGYPGDNFSLEAALDIFKDSKSLEDFEKQLNTEKNNVNNLDLNEDGEIDYIRVEDKMNGDVHAIVLQVPVSKNESQDIAVIEIEKTGKENAMLQIIGSADVYGEEKIVEPFKEEGSGGKGGPDADYEVKRIIVNVYFWRPVRFIYAPNYVVWVSPWRWAYYPSYWRPWRPYPYHRYHSHVVVHRRHYHVVTTHRVTRAHKVYTPHRRSSTVVVKRTNTVKVNRTRNKTTVTRSTTTTKQNKATAPNATRKRSSTAVQKQNRNGKVSGSRSTTKVQKQGKKGTVSGSRSTTKVQKQGKKGSVSGSRSTTKVQKQGKKGTVKGKKTTTTVKRKRNG